MAGECANVLLSERSRENEGKSGHETGISASFMLMAIIKPKGGAKLRLFKAEKKNEKELFDQDFGGGGRIVDDSVQQSEGG